MTRRKLYPVVLWSFLVVAVPCALIALGAVVFALTDSETVLFDNPGLWWLGAVGPIAGLLCMAAMFARRSALERFTSARLAPLLAPRLSPVKQALRAGLGILALLGVVAAIIGPRWGIYLEKQRVLGVDIVVALDVSRSMLAQDVSPNRLELAKRLIREQLVERAAFRGQHRLGLLAFAGSTSLRLPLTTDHLAFRNKLEAAQAGSVPRGGTAISQAIDRAADLFERSPKEATRLVLLFTDGEDHEGDPIAAAQTAWQEHGVRVFTVGVGDPNRAVGAEIPASSGGQRKPLLHDGQIVFSKLDVEGLSKIAAAGDGRFVAVRDLHTLVDAVASMRKSELSTDERVRRRPQYQWFLAASLLLLGIQTLLGETRAKPNDSVRRIWQQEAQG